MNKALEGRDLREAIQELAFVDGIFWRAESPFFNGFQQPAALGRVLDVGYLIAGGAAVDLLEALDGLRSSLQIGLGYCATDDGRGQVLEVFFGETVGAVIQMRIAGRL